MANQSHYGGEPLVYDSDYRAVRIFTDEIHVPETSWIYTGSLFADTRFLQDVITAVLNARYDIDGWEAGRTDDAWKDAIVTSPTVTFDQCNDPERYDIAHRWLTLVRNQADVTRHMNLKLTGTNTDTLTGETDNRRYTAILREHLIDARTHFFGESIEVNLETITCPDWLEDQWTNYTAALTDITDPLTAIGNANRYDRDHDLYKQGTVEWQQAHLLQFLNVVTGAAATLLTDVHVPSRQATLAWCHRDLIQASMSYEHPTVDRYTLSFYPKPDADGNNSFYYWRDIQQHDPHTESLTRFL